MALVYNLPKEWFSFIFYFCFGDFTFVFSVFFLRGKLQWSDFVSRKWGQCFVNNSLVQM